IQANQARYALVVASAIVSRLVDYMDPLSVNFGDGAAAIVVGPVSDGTGFFAHASRSVGELQRGMCVGPRFGQKWYEGGPDPFRLHTQDFEQARSVVLNSADYAVEAMDKLAESTGWTREQVTHFYGHQPVEFFNDACRMAAGLWHCKTTDTFREFA